MNDYSELHQLAHAAQNGSEKEMLALWEKVRRYVIRSANRWHHAFESRHDIMQEDLVSCGYIALTSAVRYWNPERGNFLQALQYYILQEFSEAYGIRTVKQKSDPLNGAGSLDTPLDDSGEGACIADITADPMSAKAFENVEDDIYTKQLHDLLEQCIEHLPAGEAVAVRGYYWHGLTDRAMAEQIGETAYKVKYIRDKGLRHLRREKALKQFERNFNYYAHGSAEYSIEEQFLLQQESFLQRCHLAEDRYSQSYANMKRWERECRKGTPMADPDSIQPCTAPKHGSCPIHRAGESTTI